MGTMQLDEDLKLDMDDSGCVQDEPSPTKSGGVDAPTTGVQLLDLSDDVLLYILRHCVPRDLKALGFCCTRLARLVLERSLWRDVDARDHPCGRARFGWIVGALHGDTTRLMVAGHARDAVGCLGYIVGRHPDQRELEHQEQIARVIGVEPIEIGLVDLPEMPMGRGRRPQARFQISAHQLPRRTDSPTWPEERERDGFEVVALDPHPVGEEQDCLGPRFTVGARLLGQLGRRCPRLAVLALEYCNINCRMTAISQFPPTLRELSLRGTKCFNQPLDKSFLFKIQDYLPDLETVDVSECDWLEPSSLLPLSKLRALLCLRARHATRLCEFVAYASLAARYGFRSLVELDLRGCPVGDSEVSALGWLPSLRELRLQALPLPPAPLATHRHEEAAATHSESLLEYWEQQEPEFFRNRVQLDTEPMDCSMRPDANGECANEPENGEGVLNGDLNNGQETEDTGEGTSGRGSDGAGPTKRKTGGDDEQATCSKRKKPTEGADEKKDVEGNREGEIEHDGSVVNSDGTEGPRRVDNAGNLEGTSNDGEGSKSSEAIGGGSGTREEYAGRSEAGDDNAKRPERCAECGLNLEGDDDDEDQGEKLNNPERHGDNGEIAEGRAENGERPEGRGNNVERPEGRGNNGDRSGRRRRKDDRDRRAGHGRGSGSDGPDNGAPRRRFRAEEVCINVINRRGNVRVQVQGGNRVRRAARQGAARQAGAAPAGDGRGPAGPGVASAGERQEPGGSASPRPGAADPESAQLGVAQPEAVGQGAGELGEERQGAVQPEVAQQEGRQRTAAQGAARQDAMTLEVGSRGTVILEVGGQGAISLEVGRQGDMRVEMERPGVSGQGAAVQGAERQGAVEPQAAREAAAGQRAAVNGRARQGLLGPELARQVAAECIDLMHEAMRPRQLASVVMRDGVGVGLGVPVMIRPDGTRYRVALQEIVRQRVMEPAEGRQRPVGQRAARQRAAGQEGRASRHRAAAQGPARQRARRGPSRPQAAGRRAPAQRAEEQGAAAQQAAEQGAEQGAVQGAERGAGADGAEGAAGGGEGAPREGVLQASVAAQVSFICFRGHGCDPPPAPEPEPQCNDPQYRALYFNFGHPSHVVYGPPRHVSFVAERAGAGLPPQDPAALVSDASVRRFGRADGERVSYVVVGPGGAQAAGAEPPGAQAAARPERSALHELSLVGYRHVTDRSLVHLASAAPELRRLDVRGSGVSEAGVQRFRALRPDCEVLHGDAPPADA
ncbi:unnamed protein product, partial [Iphiclides podalirius]